MDSKKEPSIPMVWGDGMIFEVGIWKMEVVVASLNASQVTKYYQGV